MPRNRNEKLVPQANNVLDQMKFEIASELGISDYLSIDKGNLPARINGKIGGEMVKRMIKFAQQNMVNTNTTIPPITNVNE